ncbi:MAG: TetR/AcrR family transcriptional regulator [Anaerolineales bacterium]|nr:TetR/AcrR family transcriptional regulator [Anaerolineales bacterium]
MSEISSRSEQRREQILTAAQAVFARKGIDSTRMDDIVAESGLSKGALYWYFKSKDDIINAIFHRFFEVEIRDLESILHTDEPAENRLSIFTAMLMQSFMAMDDLVPVGYEFYVRAMRDDQLRSILQTYFIAFYDLITELVNQGVRLKEFQPDTDAGSIALSLMSAIEGLFFLHTIQPIKIDLNSAAQSIMELTLDGIRTLPTNADVSKIKGE